MSDAGSEAPSIDPNAPPKARIVAAGVKLFTERGADAATIRAIAAAASVQPPTIFRHFGDKDGLLDAIAQQIMVAFLRWKTKAVDSGDPVEDLRVGTVAFMRFGIAYPDVFMHMFARPDRVSTAAAAGKANLRARVRKAALTGQLAVSEQRAYDIIDGLARGTVMEMLERPEDERDGMIAAAGDAAIAAVLTGDIPSPNAGARSAASLLRAHLDDLPPLSPGERLLLSELLGRIADDRPGLPSVKTDT